MHRDVRANEAAMRQRAVALREFMPVDEVLAVVRPAHCYTNLTLPANLPKAQSNVDLVALQKLAVLEKAPSVLSPHPSRAHHLIGDTFRVLQVFWDADDRLAYWIWEYPPRD